MNSIKNIEHVMKRRSFPDFFNAMNNFVDLKEWSEVGGVYDLCRNILINFKPKYIFDIGCGKRPTLGTLMALNYKTDVYCVDPQLSNEYSKNIIGLFKHSMHLNDFSKNHFFDLQESETSLVICNHSHASKRDITRFLSKMKNWVYITVPCCVDNKLSNQKCVHYKDIHMHTPKNDVFIFSNNSELLKKII